MIEERKRAEEIRVVQNTRLELLLKPTKEITSNLDLREALRQPQQMLESSSARMLLVLRSTKRSRKIAGSMR